MRDAARTRNWNPTLMDGEQPRCPVCCALYGFLAAFTSVVGFGLNRPKRARETCASHYCRARACAEMSAMGPISNDELRAM